MEFNWFNIFGVAGIGGLALAAVVFIFKEIIRKEIFPKLTKEQAYALLNRIVLFIFILGILGILTYLVAAYINVQSGKISSPQYVNNLNSSSSNSNNQNLKPTPLPINNNNRISPNNTAYTSNTYQPQNQTNINNVNEIKHPTPTPETNRMSGLVVDENQMPLQGANVTIQDIPEVLSTETSSLGAFNLDKIPKKYERFRLVITLKGYEPWYEDVILGDVPRIKLRRIK